MNFYQSWLVTGYQKVNWGGNNTLDSKDIKNFLNEIEKDLGALPSDLHITRKACALVAISEGKVIKLQEPEVHHCPLFTTLFDFKELDKQAIEKKFEKQCDDWGMFTCHRKVCDEKIIVPFGASEMIMYALKRNNIGYAVVACEGAGTVITDNPGLVQGIGAYMNGLFYTTPIPGVINNIREKGGTVLSAGDAKLNQFEGVVQASRMGCRKIAVTVRGDEIEVIKNIREFENGFNSERGGSESGFNKNIKPKKTRHMNASRINPENPEYLEVVILAICNTGISAGQAQNVSDNADLAWACASKEVRNIAGPRSILQVGMKIPVFVMTEKGLDFISAYSSDVTLKEKLGDISKKHYITSGKFEDGSVKIQMGKFQVFLYETEKLPVNTEDEPGPLV
jgi:putative methanogenesis marker protein 8